MVFALNTVVGFACSVGMNLGFNSTHHHDEEAIVTVVHIHKDGKRHVHEEKKGHKHDKSHHHDHAGNHHKPGSEKDGCCNDKVRSFEQLDKSVPASLSIQPLFLTAFLTSYYSINILSYSNVVTDKKQFVRSYHPPIPDIRIAIQSFQI